MTPVLRLLGGQALLALLRTMPPTAARAASLLLALSASAIPLVALLHGDWLAGDVLVAFWLENLVLGFWTAVMMATSTRADPLPLVVRAASGADRRVALAVIRMVTVAFFLVHFGGFLVGHAVFTFSMARTSGTTGSVGGFALIFLALSASYGLATAVHWFARGERHTVGPRALMTMPYRRLVVLHVALVTSPLLAHLDASAVGLALTPRLRSMVPGLVLIALKIASDVVAALRPHRSDVGLPISPPISMPISSPISPPARATAAPVAALARAVAGPRHRGRLEGWQRGSERT